MYRLRKRVAISNQHDADAFISLHYDANPDSRVQALRRITHMHSNKRLPLSQ